MNRSGMTIVEQAATTVSDFQLQRTGHASTSAAVVPGDGSRPDEFLAMLGHEMRNSLSALRNSLDVWCMSHPELMDDLRHIMDRQVKQLTRLSDDLLDSARVGRGHLSVQCERISLQEVIEEACEEIRPAIDNRGHTLSVSLPDAPIIVFGDSARLVQVFANLLQNSAKFTGRNGSLCISVELQSRSAAVRVSDNGCGIDQRALASVFEAGSIANVTEGPVNDGLGIGLKLVKAIVQSHGGSVAAQSGGVGHGCEITVHLPTWNGGDCGSENKSLPLTVPTHLLEGIVPTYRIVIVDDDCELGQLLAQLLRRIGQSVSVATNGLTAIKLILQNRPQVVFLDLMMGEHDGYEVAYQLRKHAELDAVVLIALSGLDDEQHKRRALDAGCNMYLVKPVGVMDFAKVLRGVASMMHVRTSGNII
ncbi:MAG: hybrid sensor histidine kinase/response regulator [Planctomycetaceae bacterium]|nr:hybrid sensor histidine kinase/response regulator [Planctomycetaceae bacterium]